MRLLIGVGAFLVILIFFLVLFVAKNKISVIINNKDIKVKFGRIKVYDSTKNKRTKKNKAHTKTKEFELKYKSFKQIFNLMVRVFDDKNDDLLNIIKYINKTFDIKRIDVSLDYGFDEAAITGVTNGLIWNMVSFATAFLYRHFDVKKVLNVAVKPDYTKKCFDFNSTIVVMVSFKNLLLLLRYIKRFKNTLKGGYYNGSI